MDRDRYGHRWPSSANDTCAKHDLAGRLPLVGPAVVRNQAGSFVIAGHCEISPAPKKTPQSALQRTAVRSFSRHLPCGVGATLKPVRRFFLALMRNRWVSS